MATMPSPVSVPDKMMRVFVRTPKCSDSKAPPVTKIAIKADPKVAKGS